MSLFKRGGTYTSFVWMDGVRRARALHTGNKRLAELLDRQHKDELIERQFQQPQFNPSMTFSELYTRFLAEGDVKPYHLDRGKPLLGFFGEMEIGRITRNDVIRYRRSRHEEFLARQKKPGRKLTDTTINRDIEAIRRMLFWSVDEGILRVNPLARAPMVRERRKKRPVMPVAEEVKLLASCASHLVPIVILALDTGMRRGELLHQSWENIDFERRLLFVNHSKTPEGEMRPIPLTNRAFELLSPMRQPFGLVFTYKGNLIGSLKTGWNAAIRRAGLPHYRFHDLRHTFNTRLIEANVIADTRKALMGHSDGSDVHAGYSHIEVHLLRDAIVRLEAWHSAKMNSLTTNAEANPLSAHTEEVIPNENQPG